MVPCGEWGRWSSGGHVYVYVYVKRLCGVLVMCVRVGSAGMLAAAAGLCQMGHDLNRAAGMHSLRDNTQRICSNELRCAPRKRQLSSRASVGTGTSSQAECNISCLMCMM